MFKQHFLLIFTAVIAGVTSQIHWYSGVHSGWQPFNQTLYEFAINGGWQSADMNLRLTAVPLLVILVLYLLRFLLTCLLSKINIIKPHINTYKKKDIYTYLTFLLTGFEFIGFYIHPFIIIFTFLLSQLYLIYHIIKTDIAKTINDFKVGGSIAILFFFSGFAALIYQICWQRLLLISYGVNIESVTIIVSIFLLGLGIGAFIGGIFTRIFPNSLPWLFLFVELGIGIFGIFSYDIILKVSEFTINKSLFEMSAYIYLILVIPTLLMGATLPILVEHINRYYKNVGKTVSYLYFINTLGSAVASFVAVNVLLVYLTLKISILIAVIFNIVVGIYVFFIIQKQKNNKVESHTNQDSQTEPTISNSHNIKIPYGVALLLAVLVGFISLSQEIIWVRVIGYFIKSKSSLFGNVLGCFLVGLAFGSLKAESFMKQYKDKLLLLIGKMLLYGGTFFYLSLALCSYLSIFVSDGTIIFLMFSIGFTSFLMGTIFPVLAHYIIKNTQHTGYQVSILYLSNIIGSVAGPLITGFVLFEYFSMPTIILGFTLAIILLAFIILKPYIHMSPRFYKQAAVVFVLLLMQPLLYYQFWDKLHFKHKYFKNSGFTWSFENRSGIIQVKNDLGRPSKEHNILVGSGTYDGTFNIQPATGKNWINRAYMISALHPKPKRVLFVGLGTGSWTKVIADNANVEHMDVIEINKAYPKIISQYKHIQDIFHNPKIKFHYTDGRRWMNQHQDIAKYDFIVMNVTFHYKTQANNIVSHDFLRLVKKILKEDGILYMNTTGSWDISYTFANTFKYVTLYGNIAVGSDKFIKPSCKEMKNRVSSSYELVSNEGRFDYDSTLNFVCQYDLSNQKNNFLSREGLYLITDNNLASEFKTSNRFYMKQRNWFLFFKDVLEHGVSKF